MLGDDRAQQPAAGAAVHPVVHVAEREVQTMELGLIDRALEEPALPEVGEVDERSSGRGHAQPVDDNDVVGAQRAGAVDADAFEAPGRPWQ